MKIFMYGFVLVFLALLSLPTPSDAFSRRSSNSDFAPNQFVTTPARTGSSENISAQSVPEPPVLLLMSIGLGVFALGSAIKAFRKQS